MYVFITATGPTQGDIRLINDADNTNMTGRLEVYYEGQWGTVCDDFFDNLGAMVACRQLGLNPVGAIAVTRAGFGQGVDPIWLDNVNCDGTEPNIDSCPHNAWGTHNCAHFEDAGVICLCKFFLKLYQYFHSLWFCDFSQWNTTTYSGAPSEWTR